MIVVALSLKVALQQIIIYIFKVTVGNMPLFIAAFISVVKGEVTLVTVPPRTMIARFGVVWNA